MGRKFNSIDARLQDWIDRQAMFFVATAPNDLDGHVNVSPKGGEGVLRVLGPHRVAYVDLVGSGVETVAHLRQNGRIVLMFCAFSGPPKIVRLHGRGRAVPEDHEEYQTLLSEFSLSEERVSEARGIVVVDVTRITDSCGFGVPRMELVGERNQLRSWSRQQEAKHGGRWKARYMGANNVESIDGLPGYDPEEPLPEDEVKALSSSGRAL